MIITVRALARVNESFSTRVSLLPKVKKKEEGRKEEKIN